MKARSESYDFILGARGVDSINSLRAVLKSDKALRRTIDTPARCHVRHRQ